MSARWTWSGLDELMRTLAAAPAEYMDEATTIIRGTAEETKRELLVAYPPTDGPMRRGVRVIDKSTKTLVRFDVLSASKEATWWEYGTQNRHTQQGWNRGAEAAHPNTGLISIAIRRRRLMISRLIEMVERTGLFRAEAA